MTRNEILDWLVLRIAQLLGVEPAAVDTRERFVRYGLDSLGTTRMIADLSAALGRSLSPTLVWEYPSIESLATYLTEGDNRPTPATTDALKRGPHRSDEPIAIVGMACRFPGGADDPRLFWRLLCEGFDAITDVPKSRWSIDDSEGIDSAESHRTYLRRGGFLRSIDGFDPLHFHVSPREAEQMDPQQRLMLELTWEAIEDAGIAPETLRGSSTGVFTGVVFGDYDVIQDVTGTHKSNQYTTTGSVQSIIANRISYVFGMSGPSYVINAACASSLLAVHLACQSIRNGECTAALAGGVQLNMAMSTTLGVSQFGALSPDGLCRTFDARANGYVRGEGAGVILLRSLSEARRRGERIYAIIRGSASNNNGAGNGLTAPNPEAQRAVIVDAYERAQVDPTSVQYVELHGTGTILGDPIEASALGAAYTRNWQAGSKLLVGSVKTNIGHLEASAGIAGVMKTALALHHRRLPPSLHYETGNPYIDFEALRLEVVTTARAWPNTQDGVLRAGVSSFGFGGSNAHAILESWPEESIQVLPLAAESPEQLEKLSSRMREWLAQAPEAISVASICSAAGKWLSSGPVRAAFLGSSRAALAKSLEQWSNEGATGTKILGLSRKPVFVFSGLGSQWAGMSRRVWDTNPAFVATLRQCDGYFEPLSGWSIVRTLFDDDARDLLNGMDRLDVIVPVLVAVQIAMARVWTIWGIEPGAVIGHSVGEIAAAHVAGMLDLQQAMLIAHHTALAYRASVENGTGMLAFVGCPASEMKALLGADEHDVHVAGQNDPHSCIVSGTATRVRALVEECTRRDIFNRILGNVYAHCPAVRAFTTNLSSSLEGLVHRNPRVPLMSTVSGTWMSNSEGVIAHWKASIEQPVQFRAGIEALWSEGFGCFVEMSPHAILTRSINTTITAMGREPIVIASQIRGEAERAPLLNALGRMFELGADVNWDVFMSEAASVALPSDLSLDRASAPKNSSMNVLVLSARTEPALNAYALRLGDHLRAHPELSLSDVAYGLATTRSAMEHRLALVTTGRDELLESLDAAARGHTAAGVQRGIAGTRGSKVAFVFPGQGSQWVGMGRQLCREEPAFRDAISACDEAIRKEAGFSVLEELDKPEATSRLGETIVAQPALFAIEVALARLFQSWSVVPSMVVGHSVGEIAAAHIAGMLDLEQAARLVSIRARIMQRATGHGKMVSVALAEEDARRALAELQDRVGIAAVNDPNSAVLSGDIDAVDAIVERLSARGIVTRALRVNYAFHSPQMAPFVEEFVQALGDLPVKPGHIPMISTVTGKPLQVEDLDARYWGQNIRQTVQFAQAIKSAAASGHQMFVEMGPHPVLAVSIEQTLAAQHAERHIIPTLRRDQDERQHALGALGALYTHGCSVDWSRLYPQGGRVVPLPTYPWQRERYWIDTTNSAPLATQALARIRHDGAVHPLLGAPFSASTQPDVRFWQQIISVATMPWLGEHRIQEQIVFPGAGYVELALEAGAASFGDSHLLLEDITFQQMLALGAEDAVELQVVLKPDGARSSFQIASRREKTNAWVEHARGFIELIENEPLQIIDAPKTIAARLANPLDPASFYQGLRDRHIHHGSSFQGIVELHLGDDDVLAKIRLPEDVPEKGFLLHPALLDACLQASFGHLVFSSNADTYIPVGIDRIRIRALPARSCWAFVTKRPETGAGADQFTCDLRILDDDGRVVVELDRFRARRIAQISPTASDALARCVYQVAWHSAEPLPPPKMPAGGVWLVFADRDAMAGALTDRLSTLGQRCIRIVAGSSYQRIAPDVIRIDSRAADDYQRIFREFIGDEGVCHGVVHLASLDVTPFPQTTPESLAADLSHATVSATYLAQAIVRHGFRDAPRLFLVTRGAQFIHDDDPVSVAQAPILGLGKTIAIEHPALGCTRIDLSPVAGDQDADLLLREFVSKAREDQIALRGERRYVARLVQSRFGNDDNQAKSRKLEPARGRPFQLKIREPGILDNLALYEMEMPSPGSGEVLIEVEAAGLNFRDVLMALGVLPDDASGADQYGPRLGGECAGRIVAVGEGSSAFVPGQSVIAFGARAFGSFMVARNASCALKPEHLSWEEAAVLPLVFMTAYYALEHVGRLRKGERVLIHAGTGGVGLAAIQWAQHVGAEVFATAGSEEKRAYLREIGVPHVLNSRSLDFADEIRRMTNGEGVDVVLNSLSGEFIPASLGVLRDWGRFVEIGMRDYYENRPLGTRPFLRNLSFSLLDLRKLMADHSERAGALLRELLTMFTSGILKPLPTRSFPISQASQAFQTMAQAKHIGKIALVVKDADARIMGPEKKTSIIIREDRSYLITGGLGGLGLSLAQWFVEQGARNLVLVGRRPPNEAAVTAIRAMEEAGACVRSVQADVSQEKDVIGLFAAIREDLPPLGGIVHAAAVLEDHTLLEQSSPSFANVFAPKALGAWNLHMHSAALSLDFFVMYSSVAALLGSPGQANYCASNAFLDALAHERARRGLPAMSIQWGGFSEIGLAAASDIRGKRLSSRGLASFSPAEGLEALRRLLEHPRPVVGIVRFDARQWVEFYPNTASAPFFAEVTKQDSARDKSDQQAMKLLVQLRAAPPADRVPLLERHVMEQLGAVLRLDPKRIDRMAPFQNLGMDSLMNLELRNRLEATLGSKLSATVLFTYSTTVALAEHLHGLLLPSENEDTGSVQNTPLGLTEEKHQRVLDVDQHGIEAEVDKLSGDALLDELARELSDD